MLHLKINCPSSGTSFHYPYMRVQIYKYTFKIHGQLTKIAAMHHNALYIYVCPLQLNATSNANQCCNEHLILPPPHFFMLYMYVIPS